MECVRKGDKVRLTASGAEFLRQWDVDVFEGEKAVVYMAGHADVTLEFAPTENRHDRYWSVNPDEHIAPAASTTDDDNDEIIDLLRARLVVGRATYGVGVTVNDGHDWEIETLEEVLDGLVYTAARLIELRRKRERGASK